MELVHRFGPLPYADVIELALYDEELGFYSSGVGRAGRSGGDFLTSPEVGPLFGAVVARALDSWWDELGQPDPFVVAEAGAGVGTLARWVLAAGPSCAPALRYVMVERSEALRLAHANSVPLEPPGWVLGPRSSGAADDDDDEPGVALGTGPMCTSLAELPAQRFVGVVLANELLDNLAFSLLRRTSAGWDEIRVGESDGALVNFPVPADESLVRFADRFAGGAPVGAWIPVQHAAQKWLASALACVARGRVVVIDYADATSSLAARPPWEWVRTYRDQARGEDPLSALGLQDITCEVAVDQLAAVRPLSSDLSQADWLRSHGLDSLVDEASAAWHAAAASPTVESLKHRSRLSEAAALTDPAGLGAFRALEWVV